MTVGNNVDHQHAYSTNADYKLKAVSEEKDIGVIIDQKLTFSNHLAAKISKANQVLGLIWRVFEHKEPTTLVQLYKALVRPHLEYANQVWAPHLKKDIEALENVQRRATRMIPGYKDKPYEEIATTTTPDSGISTSSWRYDRNV